MEIVAKGILKNKAYLYLTEFFSGMSVMAVELGASRLLAPYFSSSQIVWTIIIGTIMIAMALGNIYGGAKADKDPNPSKLYGRIVIAAIWIAAIPVVGKFIILGVSGIMIFTISTNLLIWAAFFSCMIIFVYPLFLLGTVTPSLVKYTTDNLEDNGKTVGLLGAANTIGSIIGTFVPTFISIPAVGTSVTFLIFAGILLLLAIIYFISVQQGKKRIITSSVLFIICCIFGNQLGFAFWDSNITLEDESVYNYLQVNEDEEEVALSTNVLIGVQSVYMKSEELTGMYYDYAMMAPLMSDAFADETAPMDILVLGMGTGTYATQCDRYFENVTIEGVEIDEKITALAYEYFELSDNIEVTTFDGRAFLNASDSKYDVIMVDAYQDITIPFQMSSVEFFKLIEEHLNEGGVMVVNMNMSSDESDGINAYLSDTIASVFDKVYTVDVGGGTNRELFATNNIAPLDSFSNHLQAVDDTDLQSFFAANLNNIKEYTAGNLILTDDKAPVELLGMRAIDDLIADEIDYYKDILEHDGIQGLLEEM